MLCFTSPRYKRGLEEGKARFSLIHLLLLAKSFLKNLTQKFHLVIF